MPCPRISVVPAQFKVRVLWEKPEKWAAFEKADGTRVKVENLRTRKTITEEISKTGGKSNIWSKQVICRKGEPEGKSNKLEQRTVGGSIVDAY